jgi:hypothetical protein
MTHRPTTDTFLRAAVKTGLRLQRNDSGESGDAKSRAGVQTVERIKASLQKKHKLKRNL